MNGQGSELILNQWLKGDERLDRLVRANLDIIQSPTVFSYSLDAVLLAHFANLPRYSKAKIVDLCAGNGAVGLLLSEKTQSPIIGIELQERLADMAQRSIQLNHLDQQVSMIHGALKDATQWIPKDSVDVVTCNPPYFSTPVTSQKNPNIHLAIARHEIYTNLNEVMKVTSDLLKMNGKAYFVHRPDRLVEILAAMQKNRLAPKRMQLVYPKEGREANILLIEGIKDGKDTGFRVMPPLTVYSEENDYLPEIREIMYGKEA
ncbi:tRNA1(Val) (adenine(37)-N6)-methyltransferase [Carnobacterium gallinarum]|uniref:tRNA1(Val) (adenine(37)-N6)-methyltransferase n=1 Tax=Carnobacterium gallinarum TaxID=2749 RepID=UPI00068EE972|nr:tRNA1(Val) (adenine(37)-N6)-methyltransferase [Carnobacterium gallinarum]